MAYRDVRNLVEMLRALNYPQLISMESFRAANFPLVADLLLWLIKRFDPDVDILPEINTEDQRVGLIRNVAQFMALKANVKLNTKRLYQADGYAVRELLKLTAMLYDALDVDVDEDNEDEDEFNGKDYDLTDKIGDLKLSRQLASEITTTGATLFDLLGREVDLKFERHKSIGRQFEVNDLELGIREAIAGIEKEIADTEQLIGNVSTTMTNLDAKIDRHKTEIERYEKRLVTLKKVRPAFLDEFTALEVELEELFIQYSQRMRNLNYLERQFTEAERLRYEKQLETVSPRIETIPLEENDDVFLDMDEDMEEPQRSGAVNRPERPRASTGDRSKKSRSYTNIPISSGSLDSMSESDSEDLFVDKEEPELLQSDDESLALDMSHVDRHAPSGRKTSSKIPSNSDDDF